MRPYIFEGKGGPEPEYEGEGKEKDPIHYIPTPPPAWLNEDEEDTRHDPLSLTERLKEAVEAAEYKCNEASRELNKAQKKLDMHCLLERVKARIAEVEAAEYKCCICLRGDADPDDCPYCEECDVHVQNVAKHSLDREWFDVCPIAWDEWWVPRDLYYDLLGYGMLTPGGKLKQDLEF